MLSTEMYELWNDRTVDAVCWDFNTMKIAKTCTVRLLVSEYRSLWPSATRNIARCRLYPWPSGALATLLTVPVLFSCDIYKYKRNVNNLSYSHYNFDRSHFLYKRVLTCKWFFYKYTFSFYYKIACKYFKMERYKVFMTYTSTDMQKRLINLITIFTLVILFFQTCI